ncbi:MAG: transposase [Pirellulaceae bacterium]|jgi:transposase
MPRKTPPRSTVRREYDDAFKAEAVQMLVDGHSAQSIVERLGISGTNLLYRWKQKQLKQAGPVGEQIDLRLRELEMELQRVQRERDVLKKALIIFGRQE